MGKKRKKKKKHNPIVDWLLYIALRLLIRIIYLFSIERNLAFARYLGRMLWKYYHRGRKRALDNLRESFPNAEQDWLIKTGKRSFEQIAMMAMDVICTPKLVKRDTWKKYSCYKTIEYSKWMMQAKRPMLMITAHYGNFEIMGYLLGLFGFDVYSIARPLDNKFINKHLLSVRQKVGQKIINKKGASKLVGDILENGNTLCFIADQDAGRKGIFVDFFGRKASTYKSIGLIAIQYNIPINIAYCRRIADRFYFEIGIKRIIFPHEWENKQNPLEWVTAEYTKELEQVIKEDPSQYWWLHRRWKSRPKSRPKKQNSG